MKIRINSIILLIKMIRQTRAKVHHLQWTLKNFKSILLLSSIFCSYPVNALIITSELEVLRIANVDATFQSISTQNSYLSPIVVCTYNLPSNMDNEAVVRLDNIATGGFDIRIQQPENSSNVTSSDVYCLIAEEGLHTLPDGRQFEAHQQLSEGTNGSARSWGVGGVNGAVDVSAMILGTYPATSQPIVLGQVMTFNDPEFSTFWSFDCDRRFNVPFQNNLADGICIGKHVGQISGTSSDRADEILGYIVIEQGVTPTGSFTGINYRTELGGNTVAGVRNVPPYNYVLGDTFEFAVATKEAENGGEGGWAIIYGTDPLAGNALSLAIDEETVEGDPTRTHATEQVAYWVFRGVDHSDAPLSYGDAFHNINGVLSLGQITAGDADVESSALFSSNAEGDDLSGIDDEEGVIFRSPSTNNDSVFADVVVTNLTGGSVSVCAWLDIPSGSVVDGSFDPADGICQTTSANNPTLTFQWSNLPSDQAYTTFVRFRVSTVAMTTADAIGEIADGEVEDYQIVFDFTPTFATLGNIALEYVQTTDLVADIFSSSQTKADLLKSLSFWNTDAEINLANLTQKQLKQNLLNHIDPNKDGMVAILKWDTLEEKGTVGFYAERKKDKLNWERINDDLLPGLMTSPYGGHYLLLDPDAKPGHSYQYRLIELEANGNLRHHGPFGL